MKCFVPSCTNRSDCQNWKQSTYRCNVKHTFHRFPQNSDTCRVWLDLLGIESPTLSKNSRICSAHFEEKCFDRSGPRVRLTPNALPCQTVMAEQLLRIDVKPLNFPEDHAYTKLSMDTMECLMPEIKEEATISSDGTSQFDEWPLTPSPVASKEDKETMTLPVPVTDHSLEKSWLRQRIRFLETDSKKKVRLLQQQIRRKNDQLIRLKSMLEDLKNKEVSITNQAKPTNMLDETASPAESSTSNGNEESFSRINCEVENIDTGPSGGSSDVTDGYLRTIIEQNRAIMQQNNLLITLILDTMERVKTLENQPTTPVVNKKQSFLLKFQNLQFPINSIEKVMELEEILQNENNFDDAVNEFAKFGGSATYDFVKRVLSTILHNDVALMYSWLGRQAKQPFYKLKLAEVVICAAEEGKVAKNKKETEVAMQNWLKRAGDRKAAQR